MVHTASSSLMAGKNRKDNVKFEVLMGMTIRITVPWDVETTGYHIPENSNFHKKQEVFMVDINAAHFVINKNPFNSILMRYNTLFA
jgi:hypothetical protein